ncbi:MAG TPA: hypothetical protein VH268_08955 [Solirubrobacterales bacterium]|nr:hypothetical protein [Solirubrobacterales bacterium]
MLGDDAALHGHDAVPLGVGAAVHQVDRLLQALHRGGLDDHDPLRLDLLEDHFVPGRQELLDIRTRSSRDIRNPSRGSVGVMLMKTCS